MWIRSFLSHDFLDSAVTPANNEDIVRRVAEKKEQLARARIDRDDTIASTCEVCVLADTWR